MATLTILSSVTMDMAKLSELDSYSYECLIEWMLKYQSPKNEASLFKNIPNNSYNIGMVNTFRRVAVRDVREVPLTNYIPADKAKLYRVAYRLKGRGPRKAFKFTNPHVSSNLRHENAETFALYQHIDLNY